MQRLLTSLGALGSGLVLAIACSEDKSNNLFPNSDAGVGGLQGVGGTGAASNGGTGGSGGTAGANGGSGAVGDGGSGAFAGSGGGPDAGPNLSDAGCHSAQDCADDNACTLEACQDGVCVAAGFAASGAACGSTTSDECTLPDTCDGAGVCQPNNTGAPGTPCGSSTNNECTHPDTCDAQGVCQPNNETLGTACGSATTTDCSGPDQCDDAGQCSPNNAAAGTLCGDATENECTHHDVCGNGVCLPNDAPNGSACNSDNGSCTQGACIDGQPLGCPADVANSVPFNISWSSVGRPNLYGGSCDAAGTPDYALVFTAPEDGTYRFAVHALVDSTPYTGADFTDPITEPPDGDAVITIADGSCGGQNAAFLGCNDDVKPDEPDKNIDSQFDLALTAQHKVTVYLNEVTQLGGGTGTLSITLVVP